MSSKNNDPTQYQRQTTTHHLVYVDIMDVDTWCKMDSVAKENNFTIKDVCVPTGTFILEGHPSGLENIENLTWVSKVVSNHQNDDNELILEWE